MYILGRDWEGSVVPWRRRGHLLWPEDWAGLAPGSMSDECIVEVSGYCYNVRHSVGRMIVRWNKRMRYQRSTYLGGIGSGCVYFTTSTTNDWFW